MAVSAEELGTRAGGGQRIRLLSYNIQVGIPTQGFHHYLTHSWRHLLPSRKRQENLRRIARFIGQFDIIGLQEVDAGSLRSGYINQAEYLAREAGLPHCYHKTNRDLGHLAQHSLAVLSRFPARVARHHRLPGRIPGRGALELHYGSPGQPLVLVLIHLSLGRRARRVQLEYIAEVVASHRHVIVMGDLNCTPDSDELCLLLDRAGLAEPPHRENTYPSWRPRRSYDHILVSPSLEVRKTRVYPRFYSDHLPVCVEIGLPAEVGHL
ncbi:MAG TPA: EEP domain-containing protein [Chromatiales bacterium]|nr:EEP domain-containing protein [Chromatiales bacterium]